MDRISKIYSFNLIKNYKQIINQYQFADNLIGGLQSVANYLNVERFGTQHQVGHSFRSHFLVTFVGTLLGHIIWYLFGTLLGHIIMSHYLAHNLVT